MELYKIPIEMAFFVFPFAAFILTIPFLIYQYNKYGAIPAIKSIVFYSLILYIINAYFLVILPLPSISEVSNLTKPTYQLIPFNFIDTIIKSTNINFNNIDSIIKAIKQPSVYITIFNLFLTLPFGFYIKYYFDKKWYQVIFYTFILSLFFELTQLSGLYGIYPRPYRIFDVDDLIVNTIGGFIGCIITPIICIFIPTKKELEKLSYKKGKKVSLLRRFLAFSIDLLFILLATICIKIFLYNTSYGKYSFFISMTIYYIIFSTILNGKTIGREIVNLKIKGINKEITRLNIFFRNFIFTYIIAYPYIWIEMIKENQKVNNNFIIILIISFILVIQLINLLFYYKKNKNSKGLFLYEVLTNTQNDSTIEFFEEELKEEQQIKSKNKNKKVSTKTIIDTKKENSCYNKEKK